MFFLPPPPLPAPIELWPIPTHQIALPYHTAANNQGRLQMAIVSLIFTLTMNTFLLRQHYAFASMPYCRAKNWAILGRPFLLWSIPALVYGKAVRVLHVIHRCPPMRHSTLGDNYTEMCWGAVWGKRAQSWSGRADRVRPACFQENCRERRREIEMQLDRVWGLVCNKHISDGKRSHNSTPADTLSFILKKRLTLMCAQRVWFESWTGSKSTEIRLWYEANCCDMSQIVVLLCKLCCCCYFFLMWNIITPLWNHPQDQQPFTINKCRNLLTYQNIQCWVIFNRRVV